MPYAIVATYGNAGENRDELMISAKTGQPITFATQAEAENWINSTSPTHQSAPLLVREIP